MAEGDVQSSPPLQSGAFYGYVGTEADWEGQNIAKQLGLALILLIPGPQE